MVVAYFKDEYLDDPDSCSYQADPGYEAAIRRSLGERVPAYQDFAYLGGFAGIYDFTPDWNPIVGWAPGADGLFLALGSSGHGFKLAPPVGEAIAASVTGSNYPIDLRPLRPPRFAEGDLLKMAYGPGARA
jgi:glycine/D-amino acid oxidase-like deaminating enzyme